MFLISFLTPSFTNSFLQFLKGQTITALDIKDMEATYHFVILMDHFLLLKSKIKFVLKIKLSNLLLKEHGTVLDMDLKFAICNPLG